ncbi:MAG TPA: hypothetical protein VFN26_15695 [Candidatus Acidoferrum sp.]|nr:hypothetical protein [Candidatus Acidoferrum sp.]
MILDTKAVSAAADRDPAALEIVARAEWLAVPVIVLGEYRLGIAQSRHRASYEDWLREWIGAVGVLEIEEETTHCYAAIGLEVEKNREADSRQRPVDCGALQAASSSSLKP